MQDYNDTRNAEQELSGKSREVSTTQRLTQLIMTGLVAGAGTFGGLLGFTSTANAEGNRSKPPILNAANSNIGTEMSGQAGPEPVAESAAGRPPEVTTAVTETLHTSPELHFQPITVTTKISGFAQSQNGVKTTIAVGAVLTTTEGINFDPQSKVVTFQDARFGTVTLHGGKTMESMMVVEPVDKSLTFPIEELKEKLGVKEEKPLGTLSVLEGKQIAVRSSSQVTSDNQLLDSTGNLMFLTGGTPEATDIGFFETYVDAKTGIIWRRIGKDEWVASSIGSTKLATITDFPQNSENNQEGGEFSWQDIIDTIKGWLGLEEVKVVYTTDSSGQSIPTTLLTRENEVVARIIPTPDGKFRVEVLATRSISSIYQNLNVGKITLIAYLDIAQDTITATNIQNPTDENLAIDPTGNIVFVSGEESQLGMRVSIVNEKAKLINDFFKLATAGTKYADYEIVVQFVDHVSSGRLHKLQGQAWDSQEFAEDRRLVISITGIGSAPNTQESLSYAMDGIAFLAVSTEIAYLTQELPSQNVAGIPHLPGALINSDIAYMVNKMTDLKTALGLPDAGLVGAFAADFPTQ